uniref:Uncharacterized protein n=1 Tax=Macaca mulatta TaxID=9544 RepID=F6YXY4_MACMU
MGAAQAGSPGSTHRGVPHHYCSASAGVLAGPSVTYCGHSEAKGINVTSGSPVQSLLDLGPGHSHLVFSFQFFPSGNKPGPCWPGPSPRANGDPVAVAKAQPRTFVGIQASEASRMEDATNIVHGLIVELSNLNRLIMGTHRDLEAFKRLNYRKTKPGGKAPLPYPSKGPGNVPRGDPPWREL